MLLQICAHGPSPPLGKHSFMSVFGKHNCDINTTTAKTRLNESNHLYCYYLQIEDQTMHMLTWLCIKLTLHNRPMMGSVGIN